MTNFSSWVLFFLVLCMNESLVASDSSWKFRARENFEILKAKNKLNSGDFASFSHTINFWYEKPFDYAIGFAVGPFGMSYPSKGDPKENFADKIRFVNYGGEIKNWYHKGFFIRGGVYYNYFNSHQATIGALNGGSVYGGLGYEWEISGVGLALEFGNRSAWFADDWRIDSKMVSIGVHFYPML